MRSGPRPTPLSSSGIPDVMMRVRMDIGLSVISKMRLANFSSVLIVERPSFVDFALLAATRFQVVDLLGSRFYLSRCLSPLPVAFGQRRPVFGGASGSESRVRSS